MIDLRTDIEAAKKGREIWLKIKRQYSFEAINDCLVVLPSEMKRLNLAALEETPAYMKRKYLRKAIIIGINELPLTGGWQRFAEGGQILFRRLEKVQCEQLLKYYRLTQFTKNIIVVSLEEPYGNGNIIGKESITLKDYIRDAIFV